MQQTDISLPHNAKRPVMLVNGKGAAFLMESISDAARYIGIDMHSVRGCCTNNLHNAGGHRNHMSAEYYCYYKDDPQWMEVAGQLIH